MSDQPNLEGQIPPSFKDSPWLIVIEADSGEILQTLPQNSWGQVGLAHEIVRQDCEGILCGPIEREPFLILANEGGVTRYLAATMPVQQALILFESRSLPLIRDHIDGQGCGSHHAGGASS